MVLRKYTGVPIHLHPRSLRRAEEEGPGATRPRCIIFQRGHQLREYINSKRRFTFGQCPNSMIDEQPINLHWQRAELGAGLQQSQLCLFKSIRNPWGFSSSSSPIINISCQIYPQYSGKWIRFGEAYASLRMKWGSRMIQWQFLPSSSMSPLTSCSDSSSSGVVWWWPPSWTTTRLRSAGIGSAFYYKLIKYPIHLWLQMH